MGANFQKKKYRNKKSNYDFQNNKFKNIPNNEFNSSLDYEIQNRKKNE